MAMNRSVHKRVPSDARPDRFRLWYDGPADVAARAAPVPPVLTKEQIEAAIPRATLKRALVDAELAGPSPAPGFQESDGIRVANAGQTAEHEFRPNGRQAVLGEDHVHVAHACKRRRWTLRMDTAMANDGDAYFGLTKASRFQCAGAAAGFDVIGNSIRGHAPQSVPILGRTAVKDVAKLGITRESVVRVTADLEQEKMTWEVFAGATPEPGAEPVASLEHPIKGWRSARLWVSLKSQGDRVRLLGVDNGPAGTAGPSGV